MANMVAKSGSTSYEYEFVNEIRSENGSIRISGGDGTSGTDLSILLEVDSSANELFVFETAMGNHTLRVTETSGLVMVEDHVLKTLGLPAKPAVLISDGGSFRWHEVSNTEKTLLLGLDGGGSFTWYEMSDCEHACD